MLYDRFFYIAMILIPLSGFGMDLMAPALPSIAQDLNCSHSLVKLSLSVYMIGFALSQFFSGILSDSWGRRPVLLVGLTIFMFSSLLLCLTSQIEWLIGLRILQGIGAATASVNAKAILMDRYQGKEFQTAASYLLVFWACGPVLGPVIGGFLQQQFHWQADFMFYTIYSLVLLLMVVFFLKESLVSRVELSFSVFRKNLSTLMSDKKFVVGCVVYGAMYSVLVLFSIMATFLIQDHLHQSSLVFGHVALLIGLAFFLGTVCSRCCVKWISADITLRLGIYLLALVPLVFVVFNYLLPLHLSVVTVSVPSFLVIFLTGLAAPILLSRVLGLYVHMSGLANSLYGTTLSVVTFLSTAVLSLVVINSLQVMFLCYLCMGVGIFLLFQFGWLRLKSNSPYDEL